MALFFSINEAQKQLEQLKGKSIVGFECFGKSGLSQIIVRLDDGSQLVLSGDDGYGSGYGFIQVEIQGVPDVDRNA